MLSSPIEEIKNRLDIVEVIGSYIKLQKAGVNYRALCPFHSEKNPSFFVSPSRQIWHCFGSCSTGGDMFKFIMKIEGVEFGDALRILAQKAGVELKRENPRIKTERKALYEISELACCFFEKQLEQSLKGKEAKKYLLGRGIKEESIKKWRLGYAPDTWQGLSDFLVSKGYKREEIEKGGLALKSEKTGNYYDRFRGRIMFPIFDLNSQVVGFTGRVFASRQDEAAKYVNTPNTMLYDKSRILYGLDKAKTAIRKENQCILVEGQTDVIMSHQAGKENAVATSGTALTNFQLKNLKRYSDNLLTAFDMDVAGDSATKRGIDLAQSLGFNVKVVAMPEGFDPADIVSKNPEDWKNLIQKAKSIHDFYFENVLSKFDKNSLEGKKEISKILLPVIKKIPNRIEKSFWIQSLANTLEVKEEDILEELQKTSYERVSYDSVSAQDSEGTEKTIFLPPKTRKELLEERLIILVIKSPKNLDLIKEKDFEFFSPQTSQILNLFKEKDKKEIEKEDISNSVGSQRFLNGANPLNDLINHLSLKAEAESFLDKGLEDKETELSADKEEEFENCLRELRMLEIKNQLDEISKEIKRAEQGKDFDKIQELVQKFNSCSKSRRDLEIA